MVKEDATMIYFLLADCCVIPAKGIWNQAVWTKCKMQSRAKHTILKTNVIHEKPVCIKIMILTSNQCLLLKIKNFIYFHHKENQLNAAVCRIPQSVLISIIAKSVMEMDATTKTETIRIFQLHPIQRLCGPRPSLWWFHFSLAWI